MTSFSCPLPIMNHANVQLAHGSGGKLSADLIAAMILPRFANPALNRLNDQAVLSLPPGRLAFSTDSYVVDPIFFPGGSIGDLAINGTINDVAMSGAMPLFLSVGLILEEGLPMATLHRILVDMERCAVEGGVSIVTGDTKVVPRGKCDKIFINTSGIGVVPEGLDLDASRICPGDQIIVSGTVGDHGLAVLTSREQLSFKTEIQSDTAALHRLVSLMLKTSNQIKVLRDPTRGGVATTLNEFASTSGHGIVVEEAAIPVLPAVRGACDVLGLDPLTVANEGKLLAVVAKDDAARLLAVMQAHALGGESRIIGEVVAEHQGLVALRTGLGVKRILEMPVAEQLPRIC
ncbi:MAG: hydrogenase expression/formation protein HypE [Desulfobulbaceae bacterium]|nr:hydrogenase expression/formation protein HypE [Desulfobulbaceae bacterium]